MSRWLIAGEVTTGDYPTGTSGDPLTQNTNKSKDTLVKDETPSTNKENQSVQLHPGYQGDGTDVKSDNSSPVEVSPDGQTGLTNLS
jgi:hypothetical protein